MNEKPRNEHMVQNVQCQVKDCIYHSRSDVCCASGITVSNENARRKAETFCSTFENKETF